MKIFKLSISFFIISAFLILTSCSDDSPASNPDDSITSFSFLNVGNWWLRDNYALDTLGNKTGAVQADSTFISGTELKLGKFAYDMKTIYAGKDSVDTNYVYTEGLQYYIHSTFLNSKIDKMLNGFIIKSPFDIGDRWIKLADYNSDSWFIMNDTITNFEIFQDYTISGLFTLNGQKGISQTMNIAGNNLSAQEFKLILNFNGSLVTPTPMSMNFTYIIHTWFNKKVGILKITYDKAVFLAFPITGSETKVTKYQVSN